MATWKPPIPGGALTSKPARTLGSAIVLLAWCYEAVQREDCSFDIQLAEVASELDESYHTIKKWWAALKDGPWFTEVKDRGRRGFRVRMATDWLDWRGNKQSQAPNTVLEDEGPLTTLEELESTVKEFSRNDERPNTVFGGSAYKVLHNDQDSVPIGTGRVSHDTPPAAEKPARKKRPTDPNQQHQGCKLFADLTGRNPNKVQAAAIVAAVPDTAEAVAVWQQTVSDWLGRGWSSTNVNGMLDRYRKDSVRNGTRTQSIEQQPIRPPVTRDRNGFEWGAKPARHVNGSAARNGHGVSEVPGTDRAARDKGGVEGSETPLLE